MRLTPLAVLIAALACATPGAAQTATGRARLRAFGDSLARLTSPAALASLRSAIESVPGRTADPEYQLRLGLVALRQGELAGDRALLLRAQAAFDEAVYRSAQQGWPWPWYALARAKFALDSLHVPPTASMHQSLGTSFRAAALNALAQALDADSTFAPAAELLAAELQPMGDVEVSGKLRQAIRRAAGSGAPTPYLLLGRTYRYLKLPDSALTAFQSYLAAGGDSSVKLLEEARALENAGQPSAGAAAYLRGADVAGPAGRLAYRDDLSWVASPAELTAFDSLPGDRLGEWIRTFWSKRDAEELRTPGERLTEHLRRWNHVFDVYRLAGSATGHVETGLMAMPGGRDLPSASAATASATSAEPAAGDATDDGVATPIFKLYTGSLLPAAPAGHRFLDDRAVVYMRHGEPDAVAFTVARPGNIPGGINWKYSSTTTEPLIFHFRCQAYCVLERFPVSLDGLGSLDSRYDILAGSMMAGHQNLLLLDRIVHDRTSDLRIGLSSDGYPQHFAHALDPLVQVFAVGRGADGTGRALAVFAIRGDRLTAEPLADGSVIYPLALRVIGTDAQGRTSRLDTVRTFHVRSALSRGEYLSGLAELPLSAGIWDVRLLISERGAGAGGAAGRLGVRIPSGTALELSDLVFGRRGAGLEWRGPDGPVPLNPLDAYRPDQSVEVYYEVSGLGAGTTYRTTLEIRGVTGAGGAQVTLSFNDRPERAVEAFRRTIDLSRLAPGQYRLTVRVGAPAGGPAASRSRLINVASE